MIVTRLRFIVATAVSALVLSACASRPAPPAGSAPEPGGATTSVDGGNRAASGPLALDELLRGRAPGLQIITRPDGGYTLRIRGLNSASTGQEPLVLVDGVEVRSGALHTALAGLTPEDIRDVEVLRDVASTSVYGMRGAGGVIIIKTNRR